MSAITAGLRKRLLAQRSEMYADASPSWHEVRSEAAIQIGSPMASDADRFALRVSWLQSALHDDRGWHEVTAGLDSGRSRFRKLLTQLTERAPSWATSELLGKTLAVLQARTLRLVDASLAATTLLNVGRMHDLEAMQ